MLLGNIKAYKVSRIGSIHVKMFDGCIRILKEVRYVPELKRNLLSIGMFDKNGCSIKVDNGIMKVSKSAMVVMKGFLSNDLYTLIGKTVMGTTTPIIDLEFERTKLWHLRLGHVSKRGLYELEKQGLLGSDEISKLDLCENCVYGKTSLVKFNAIKHTTQGILEYVHSDLWGSSRVASKGGAYYFMTIIDDYSRKVWVYCLKSKYQALKVFKTWKAIIENQTNRKVKKLRIDNGLEYCSNQFDSYCNLKGIARHRTVKGTPKKKWPCRRGLIGPFWKEFIVC